MVSDLGNLRLLGTWNQVAMRAYVRQVYCLPLDDSLDDFDELCTRIQLALRLACSHFPHFAGKICLGTDADRGKVYISTTANDVVSFKFFDDRRHGPSSTASSSSSPSPSVSSPTQSSFGWSYPELRAQGFPCKAFVGPRFGLPYDLTEHGSGVPVTEVHARVIRDGGLLMCIYIHHSISDGIGMCNFISTFAAYTFRDELAVDEVKLAHPTNIDLDIPQAKTAPLSQKLSFEDLLAKCPEYTLLPAPTGPTAPRSRQDWALSLGDVLKTGRIFRFSQAKIAMLKSIAQDWDKSNGVNSEGTYPSTFACLAALTWSFCTIARLASPCQPQTATESITNDDANNNHNGNGNRVGSTGKAHLLVPASWTRRAFRHSLDGYASNAVCMPRICAQVDILHLIGDEGTLLPATSSSGEDELGKLICSIHASITGIDDMYVATRTAMFRAAPDPRLVGVNIDPQDPLDFIVNSWRHLGGDIAFGLPGLKPGDTWCARGSTADAVRRAQPTWNMSAGLILPGKTRDSDYEILVTLDEESMARLLANGEWMKWVSEVIE